MDMLSPSPVCVRVLGGFELSGAGGEVTLAGRKLRALVALLALPPNLGWSREQLTTLLWGDRDEELARGSLRQALAELRRALGEQVLLADREMVAFDPAAIQVDAVELASLSKAGAWEAAASLYRGDLLAGVALPDGSFADWLLVEQTRLRDLGIQAMSRLLETQSGDAAIDTATRLLALDPTREATHRALMRLHAARGDRAQAIRQYQACRDVLQRELGVKPEAESEHLFKEIQASSVPRAVLPAASPSTPSAGPAPDMALDLSAATARQPRPARHRVLAAAIALVVVLGALAWWRPWAAAPPTADAPPSLAVLPFENMSNDPQQAYFAAGIADDLMTDLSRVPGLFVIARNSSAAFRDSKRDLRDVARELGVRYVIDGSVRRAGDQVRINVQLIDATTGRQQWAQRYDGSLTDIFALQDAVTGAVVNALSLRATAGEQRELASHETANPDAYDAFLRGWERYRRATPDELAKAIPHFEQAIELDPGYGRAHAALAMIYFQAYDEGWAGRLHMSADNAYRRAREYLKVAKEYPTSTAHQVAGNMSRERGWYDDALTEFQAASALDPNDSWTYAYASYALIWADRPVEAEEQILTALRLDPYPPPLFIFYQGLAQFAQDRLSEAPATFEKVVRLSPDDARARLYLAAAYGRSGQVEDAARAMAACNEARVRQGDMPFTLSRLNWKTLPLHPPEAHRLIEGLRRAGVPQWYSSGQFDKDKLTAAEIDALFFGHRLHGRSLDSGGEYGASVAADGTAMMFGEWGLGNGIARLDGDRLCFEWTGGTTNCGNVFRNPGGTRAKENEFVWFSTQRGEYSFSQVD